MLDRKGDVSDHGVFAEFERAVIQERVPRWLCAG
jgi:hypothetical protein